MMLSSRPPRGNGVLWKGVAGSLRWLYSACPLPTRAVCSRACLGQILMCASLLEFIRSWMRPRLSRVQVTVHVLGDDVEVWHRCIGTQPGRHGSIVSFCCPELDRLLERE